MDFDNITRMLNNGKKSCDGLFYNFSPEEREQHYLVEFKNVGKKEMLNFLEMKNPDGIHYKVKDSVQSINSQLEFGGMQEREELIAHMHFFIVYEGKNNVPAQTSIKLPGRVSVVRDSRKKQKKAGKMDYSTEKKEGDIYTQFGKEILKLGLQECSEDLFPGDALPRAGKSGRGKGKVRPFTVFSAKNFAEVVENVFFERWNWGEYEDSFVLTT